MRKFLYSLLLSFVGLTGVGYASEMGDTCSKSIPSVVDPFLKHCSESSYHRGPRGHKGPRGHRGHRGKRGHPGQGSSSVADRAFLLAAGTPRNAGLVVIDPALLPMVVPVDRDDLSLPIFNGTTLNGFTVPESGVYQINYFLKATELTRLEAPQPVSDASGLVMGIVIDQVLTNPIGIRSLPLIATQAPGASAVWGTHEIYVRLNQGQTVQLGVFADPLVFNDPDYVSELCFALTGDVDDEVAYLSIRKVGS